MNKISDNITLRDLFASAATEKDIDILLKDVSSCGSQAERRMEARFIYADLMLARRNYSRCKSYDSNKIKN